MADLPSMMKSAGLDVGLVVDDGPAMAAFYGDVLGFAAGEPIPLGPGRSLRFFATGPGKLKHLSVSPTPDKNRGGVDEACGYRLLTFVVEDLGAVSDRRVASGGKPLAPITVGEFTIAFLHDPDGNLVELFESTTMSPGLNAVGLTVADAEAARAFWVDVVGGIDQGTMVISDVLTKRDVSVGDTIVKFWQHDQPPAPLTGKNDAAVGIRYVTANVENCAEAHAVLVEAGATSAMDPIDLMPGIRIAFVADPDGNWLELVGA